MAADSVSVAAPTSAVPDPFKTSVYHRQEDAPPRAELLSSRIINRQVGWTGTPSDEDS
jgi:hypothetical protein